jgi:hypothetical protein
VEYVDVGFTGTQEGQTQAQLARFVEVLGIAKNSQYRLRHGDCIGSDAQAHDLGMMLGWSIVIHPPIKSVKRAFCDRRITLAPANGPEGQCVIVKEAKDYIPRNHDIVNESEFMIATPNGFDEELRSGTWATIRYAKKQKKALVIIFPDGTTSQFNT